MSSESDQSECESGSDAESLGSLGRNDRARVLKELSAIGMVHPLCFSAVFELTVILEHPPEESGGQTAAPLYTPAGQAE